jgi:hypothetical protein
MNHNIYSEKINIMPFLIMESHDVLFFCRVACKIS